MSASECNGIVPYLSVSFVLKVPAMIQQLVIHKATLKVSVMGIPTCACFMFNCGSFLSSTDGVCKGMVCVDTNLYIIFVSSN